MSNDVRRWQILAFVQAEPGRVSANERALAEEALALYDIIDDYFVNDEEGWTRGWLAWRDRAAKITGRPTSEELKALKA